MKNTTAAARETYNAYLRAWRQAHPERVKEHKRRYWEKKARMKAETNKQTEPEQPEIRKD